MSSAEEIRNQAEAARKSKNFTQAADLYSNLLEITYKEDQKLDVQACRDFVHYGECLISSDDKDEETFETAWEVLENARVGYEQIPENERPPEGLIDCHELLGELSLKQLNFEEAASQYKTASDLALANKNLSWRIPLNSLFMRGVVLNYWNKVSEYKDALDKAIEFLDTEKVNPKNSADVKDMEEIRADLVSRRDSIRQ
ncbi:hypothetical protein TRFO_39425 [Tritrichomonas foetus]|uniref:Tetratricopeptide SHNi-TPR domain-containing protein n=1 Tax=Tritrichomonas foetus TaxID=1144522 RepID=A0A1J4J9R9_9EUKA|nr:hypothetical protein TRFO_39425 [Tritrichomonas foetus]|eukprot:OHS94395.1 hypothetical protein TRFO_39425 [Tritrichomonas foetus]